MTKKRRTREQEGSQSISRAMYLLSIVASMREGGARLSTIAEQSGLHIATARRILQALVTEGFLAFNPKTKIYNIGPAIFSFATMGSPWFARREVFVPILDRIAEKTDDTVLFSIRSGNEAITLERREGMFPIRVAMFDVGTRRPLGVGAGAACILAYLGEEERESFLASADQSLRKFDVTAEHLRELVAETRKQGFTYDRGSFVKGVRAVAVPIIVDGQAVASVHSTSIAERLEADRALDVVETIRTELSSIPGISVPDGNDPLP